MAHLIFRNVNDAFRGLVRGFHIGSGKYGMLGHNDLNWPALVRRTTSRNGAVLVIDEPVTITYTHPTERVLFNAARDANCFFHLYEALWMLAGRNDVAPLAYYNSKIADIASDDGKTFNGAYGYRWRNSEVVREPTREEAHDLDLGGIAMYKYVDQLDLLVNHLKADPNSRRAVLQMWNVEDDLLKIGQPCPKCEGGKIWKQRTLPQTSRDPQDRGRVVESVEECQECKGKLLGASKDVCCNLSVLFSLRELAWDHDPQMKQSYDECPRMRALDMTVLNRSNDLVWGLLGANYVHFTILQEYMAARLGVEVGRYHHVTNNLHVYCEREDWKPEAFLADYNKIEPWMTAKGEEHGYPTISLVRDPEAFERELPNFVRLHDGSGYYGHPVHHEEKVWDEPFLETVARPMLNTFHLHKLKAYDNALAWANRVKADDWRIACTQWIERRKK